MDALQLLSAIYIYLLDWIYTRASYGLDVYLVMCLSSLNILDLDITKQQILNSDNESYLIG